MAARARRRRRQQRPGGTCGAGLLLLLTPFSTLAQQNIQGAAVPVAHCGSGMALLAADPETVLDSAKDQLPQGGPVALRKFGFATVSLAKF